MLCGDFKAWLTLQWDSEAVTLRGHRILIVESEIAFARRLQRAIERKGAETIVAGDPVAAIARSSQSRFSAGVVNAIHLEAIDQLRIPILVYGSRPPLLVVPFLPTPAPPAVFVSALERLLQYQLT